MFLLFFQLCINLANERLQNLFNDYIFKMEEEDCISEGISLVDINFASNQPVINLFLQVSF